MICTASTLSDTKWKIIAAAIAEKAKPTVLDSVAAMKITSETATQDEVACATWTKSYRTPPKCQAETLAIVAASKPSMARPITRPDGDRGKADIGNPFGSWPDPCSCTGSMLSLLRGATAGVKAAQACGMPPVTEVRAREADPPAPGSAPKWIPVSAS